MSTPRLTPLTDDELSPEQAEMLAPLGPAGEMNIFRTFIRHPELYRRWGGFAGMLLRQSSFAPRERELIVLRSVFRASAAYEWGHHVAAGRAAGLSDDELLAVADKGALASADDALVVRAVDELFDDHGISDATWSALARRFDEHQLIELPLLAGHYVMVAGALNSFGVVPEDGLPALGEV